MCVSAVARPGCPCLPVYPPEAGRQALMGWPRFNMLSVNPPPMPNIKYVDGEDVSLDGINDPVHTDPVRPFSFQDKLKRFSLVRILGDRLERSPYTVKDGLVSPEKIYIIFLRVLRVNQTLLSL